MSDFVTFICGDGESFLLSFEMIVRLLGFLVIADSMTLIACSLAKLRR